MSVNDAGGSTPVTTTVPVTPTITIAGSHSLPFENTPIVTGEGRRQIALLGTSLTTSYVPYYVNYLPPNQQVTSSLQILSNISKYSKTNPRSFKHYIEDLQVMFRIEKISEEDWRDILWLSLDNQNREELRFIPESVRTNYISLKATLIGKFAIHLKAKQSRRIRT
uniref:Uncharacterized protein n=1 Tax=Strongyloides venezuelensis TaxID=75913 RepID=A0A0K0FSG2_STRVS